MGTINHKVQFLNQNGTGYDTYHAETNVSQVYDFTKAKWLNEIIEDLERRLSNATGGIDVTELNDNLVLTMQDLDSVEALVSAIQGELAKKYVKPETGITLEDLSQNIKNSLLELNKLPAIEDELVKIRTDLKEYIDSEIEKIVISMKIDVESFITIANQTSFTLVNKNNFETDVIKVEVGGVEQFYPQNYTKDTDSNGVTTITFAEPLPEGLEVVVSYYGGIDAMNVIIDSLQDEVAIIKDTIGEMPEGLEERIGDIDDNLNTLTQNVFNVEEKVEIESQRINIANGSINTLTQDMSNVKQRVNVIEGNITSLSQEDSKLSNRITSVFNDVANVGRTTQDNTEKIINLTNTQNTQTTKVTDLENRIVALEESGGGGSSDLTQLIKEIAYLKLKQEASERIEGGVAFGDDMSGNSFGISFNASESIDISFAKDKMILARDGGTSTIEKNSVVNVVGAIVYKENSVGSRTICILDNGDIYTLLKNDANVIILCKSTDNGSTWTKCISPNFTTTYLGAAAMATDGRHIYITANGSDTNKFFTGVFNTATERWTHEKTHDFPSTYSYGCSVSVNRETLEVHIVHSLQSKSEYTSSSNLFYIKGSASNGAENITWSSPLNISKSSYNATYPSMVLREDGNPVILYNKSLNSKTRELNCYYYNGTSWNHKYIHDPSDIVQGQPSAIFIPSSINGMTNGVIWVAWGGRTYSTSQGVHIMQSLDGGQTWTNTKMISSYTGAYDRVTISANTDNKISIFCKHGSGSTYIVETTNSSTWTSRSWTTLDTTSLTISSPAEIKNTLLPLVVHGTSGGVEIFTYEKVRTLTPTLRGSAVYDIAETDYIALFVKKIGNLNVIAYINNELMDSKLFNGEYEFSKSLKTKNPVKLKLELSRTDANRKDSDAVVRIIGGRA